MHAVTLAHFQRAVADIGANGDNDTLPFDIENRFVGRSPDLANLAFEYFQDLDRLDRKAVISAIDSTLVFSERLLSPAGTAGFRVVTKISPFWNVYFNGLAIAVADALESLRSERAHSYRFLKQGQKLFDKSFSWRTFKEATLVDCELLPDGFVVQTDISSFYEHVYHHRLENYVRDLFPSPSTVADQLDRLLNKFATGRSFGLPVGGQASRIIAEVLMNAVDQVLTEEQLIWRRYVDDFFLIANTQAEAYRHLSILSHALADYGLSLNRTKTIFLSAKHYRDYVKVQLSLDSSNETEKRLREIDLHFDPYSDTADADYDELKQAVETIQVQTLLELESRKGQPDTFLVTQIGRTLEYHPPEVALQLCQTLLGRNNLHAFRASWSKIMRGVSSVRANDDLASIYDRLDALLDEVPTHSAHLLQPETNLLHYLRTLRFSKTTTRSSFLRQVYSTTSAVTVKRACIDCWRHWKDRPAFIKLRAKWDSMSPEEQRILWLAAGELGDDGAKFRGQVAASLQVLWRLGIENGTRRTFESIYRHWASGDVSKS